jgi:hypothetical protein
MENITDKESVAINTEIQTKLHKNLSLIFVVVGIVSFSLGAIVNYYTIRRLNGHN